ncbi:DUF4097 family beta strand repeat-containing protein [Streptomyces sp. NPDC090442]|uniref:DUF4097 family beta strand repeat-containing protein n=1 Tax=Streptomyces sp. NPDC090442 TaxID=3365962 RepID=UPI00380C7405
MPTFTTPAPITAVLAVPAGTVRLTAADRADTAVEIAPADPTRNRDAKAAEQTTVDCTDGVLRIQGPARNQYFGPTGAVEVTVHLPAGSRVELTAASVELRAVGRFGNVTVASEHGAIDLDEAASAHLTTTAGDVTVGRVTGPAEIRTSKGDIRITEAVRGSVTLRTDAGDISVGAAAGVSASLDAGTSHGRIRNSLKSADGSVDQLVIHATTSDGDITAHSH